MSLAKQAAIVVTALTFTFHMYGLTHATFQDPTDVGTAFDVSTHTSIHANAATSPNQGRTTPATRLGKMQIQTVLGDETVQITKPAGIDLDVTYIRRTPLYNRYHVTWQDESQMPVLAPGTEDDKRWPDYGETVTFTAHFKNKGTVASGSFQYRWYIDGAEVGSGTYTSLDPGEEGMTTHDWPWNHTVVNEQLQGQHTIAFTVDSDDLIAETYETNNTLTDRTDALSLCLQLQPETYEAHETPVDPVWPFSAEDWFQKQISALNGAFVRSVHPLSPGGVTERARIDQILIRDHFDEVACQGADGSWFSEGSHTPWSRGDPYYDLTTDVDWAGPHEFGHALLGLIDTYALGFAAHEGGSNVLDQSGRTVLLSRDYPEPGLMNDIFVHYFNEEHSAALNLNKGYRRGYFGEYLFDTPDQTRVLVLDSEGNPAPGVNVAFFQQSPDPPLRFDNNPEISVTTDVTGLAVLPNRPVSGSGTTRTGHTYRDNPFGDIESFGGPGNIFLVQIQQGTHEEFIWLDITNFNRLAWAGLDVLQIRSHVPPLGAPSPPGDFRIIRQQNSRVELQWNPSPTPGVTGYNVYRTMGADHQWTLIAGGVIDQSFSAPTHGFQLSAGFAVTAVAGSGLESGFSDLVWTLHIYSPSAVAIDDNNNRQIAASGSLLALQDQNGNFSKWLGTYLELVAYWATGWHNPEERSHMILDAAGNTIYSVPSQHEVVIGVPESQGPFRSFGQHGSAPGQLDTPTGVALWGEPCEFGGPYSVDEHTLLLAHYDSGLGGEQGEVAVASGISFVQGKHAQGVLIDGSDTLAYSRVGNLESWQGTIEFWIRPNWNGDDTGFYELFHVKDDFYDYSNQTMWLGKDPNGHLGSWGDIYVNVGDLSAGEWYHIAVAWEGPDVTLYINGTARQSGYGDPRDFTAEFFNVGSACCSRGNQVNATIDELRISNMRRIGNSDTCSLILVADSGNNRIQVFDSLGNFVSAYGSSGTGPGQFDNPQGLAVDDLENLIVVDSGNNRLQVLSFDGINFKFVKEILGEFNAPRDVAVPHHDQIVVADTGNSAIKVLDDESHLLATYVEPNDGRYTGNFSQPYGVAVDLTGKIIVADTLNNRVVEIISPFVDPPHDPNSIFADGFE